jgi:hypothetical protein
MALMAASAVAGFAAGLAAAFVVSVGAAGAAASWAKAGTASSNAHDRDIRIGRR